MKSNKFIHPFLNEKVPLNIAPLDLGVVPQSDLSSTIIVSRCYNDLNFILRLTACSTKRPYLIVIVG